MKSDGTALRFVTASMIFETVPTGNLLLYDSLSFLTKCTISFFDASIACSHSFLFLSVIPDGRPHLVPFGCGMLIAKVLSVTLVVSLIATAVVE